MTWVNRATLFSSLDYLAITLLLGAWLGMAGESRTPHPTMIGGDDG